MDDQQRAREFCPKEFGINASAFGGIRLRGYTETQMLEAITAALRAAPEGFVMVPVDSVLPCGCGCYRVCCRSCGTELGGYDTASPQGVENRPPIDGCTESNCKRCRTHPNHRGDMEHAGIGWRPTHAEP